MKNPEQRRAAKIKQYDEVYKRSLAVLVDFQMELESFKKNTKCDPVLTFFNAFRNLYTTDMAPERFKKILQDYSNDKHPSEQPDHQALRHYASTTLGDRDPYDSFLAGITTSCLLLGAQHSSLYFIVIFSRLRRANSHASPLLQKCSPVLSSYSMPFTTSFGLTLHATLSQMSPRRIESFTSPQSGRSIKEISSGLLSRRPISKQRRT